MPLRHVDRIVHKVDFERILATRSCSRSAHFALHHLPGGPSVRIWAAKPKSATELSTGLVPLPVEAVDDLPAKRPAVGLSSLADGCWLGCVVPKRHAKRAVTRNLLKRQVRSAFQHLGSGLPGGLWVVRLRAPFSKTEFISAKSSLLAAAAREELQALLARVRV